MTPAHHGRRAAGALALACVLALAAGSARAGGEDDAKEPKAPALQPPATRSPAVNPAKASAPHLRFQRSYAAALLEARIRNLPVMVSRHKDF